MENPWYQVKVDTPILVSNNGKVYAKVHFAGFLNGKVYAFEDGNTSWSGTGLSVPWQFAKLPAGGDAN